MVPYFVEDFFSRRESYSLEKGKGYFAFQFLPFHMAINEEISSVRLFIIDIEWTQFPTYFFFINQL